MNNDLSPYIPDLDKIVHSIRKYDCIPWTGSGFSVYGGYKDAKNLVKTIIDSLSEKERVFFHEKTPLDIVAEDYCRMRNRDSLIEILKSEFLKDPIKTQIHKYLYEIPQITKIVTTNYEHFFEYVYGDDLIKIVNETEISDSNTTEKVVLYKIHGDILDPNTIVISKSDYVRLTNAMGNNLIINEIISLILKHTIVFIGYSVEDVDIWSTYDFISSKNIIFKEGFLIAPDWPQHQIDHIKSKFNINYINLKSESALEYIYHEIEKTEYSDIKNNRIFINNRVKKLFSKRGIEYSSSISSSNSFGSLQLQLNLKHEGELDIDGKSIASSLSINQIQRDTPVEDVKVTISSLDGQYNTPIFWGEGLLSVFEVKETTQPYQTCKLVQKNSGIFISDVKKYRNFTANGHELVFEHNQFLLKMTYYDGKNPKVNFTFQIRDSNDIFTSALIYSFFNDFFNKKDDIIFYLDSENTAITISSDSISNISVNSNFIQSKSNLFSDLSFLQRMIPVQFRTSKLNNEKDLHIIQDIIDALNVSKRELNSIDADIEIKAHELFNEYLEKDIPVLKLVPEEKTVTLLGELFTYHVIIFGFDMYFVNRSEIIREQKKKKRKIHVICKSKSDKLFIQFSKLNHVGSIINPN